MLERAYVEIGNICNLSCSFCPGTKRAPRQMAEEEFREVCQKLCGKVKFLYLHLMGEPLLHPSLDAFLGIMREYDFKACITTNGLLLKERADILLSHSDTVHKVAISMHAPEGNGMSAEIEQYVSEVLQFVSEAAEKGIYSVLRLWNLDSAEALGKNSINRRIEELLRDFFTEPWQKRPRGFRMAKNIFLEYDGVFVWPEESTAESIENGYCHALTQQIGILADGTVVPCCLDSEGAISLGNIFESSLFEILSSDRAQNMLSGFSSGRLCEPICQKCTYARRFKSK